MNINQTHECNIFNFRHLAKYFDVPEKDFLDLYFEIYNDREFLSAINEQIKFVKSKWGFKKGIFKMDDIPSIDWFAFERVLIYVLIRFFKPKYTLETGVYYGGNTTFALKAIDKNLSGKLISIDYPDSQIRSELQSNKRHKLVGDSELYNKKLKPGFMTPEYLRKNWEFIEGDSLEIIPNLKYEFDLYIHDSDHSMNFLTSELREASKKLKNNSIILVDDIDWSNAFFGFCFTNRLWPVLLTDNGKDDLRVRTGIVSMCHPNNNHDSFT